ncbi:MAG: hypothetical protein K2X48_01800 [Chitinophagaceae bacterium]|nr:hypothetical protein [Chitinophagaceae bacterium]
MNKLVVDAKNEQELMELKAFLNSKGISFIAEDEYEFEKKLKAKKEFSAFLQTLPQTEITEEEITSVVEEARTERYAKTNKDNQNNH